MNIELAKEAKRQWDERNLNRAKVVIEIIETRKAAQAQYQTSVSPLSTKRQLSEARGTLIDAVANVLNKHGIAATGLTGRIAKGKRLSATQFYALPQVYQVT